MQNYLYLDVVLLQDFKILPFKLCSIRHGRPRITDNTNGETSVEWAETTVHALLWNEDSVRLYEEFRTNLIPWLGAFKEARRCCNINLGQTKTSQDRWKGIAKYECSYIHLQIHPNPDHFQSKKSMLPSRKLRIELQPGLMEYICTIPNVQLPYPRAKKWLVLFFCDILASNKLLKKAKTSALLKPNNPAVFLCQTAWKTHLEPKTLK